MVKKKHVLMIVENNDVPGDVRVWAQAKAAKSFGYDVSVICPVSKKYPKFFETIEKVNIYRHPLQPIKKGKIAFLLEYFNALLWEAVLSLMIFIKKPFSIIHGANPPDLIVLIALVFKLFGVKFIFDHHDIAPELFLAKFSGRKNITYRALLFFEKISCICSNIIISTNKSYKKIVTKRHKIDPSKVIVVRNDPQIGVTVDREIKEKSNLNGKKNILYLGSINSQDGADGLLYALHYLVNDLNETNFVCNMVGDGESLPSIKELAKKLAIDSYINFTGFIYEREILHDYFNQADICVEPAPDNEANRHSTFIKIMEYMAAGKPIVAFDLTETRYSTQGAALLIENGDVKGFAKAIKKLIDDSELGKLLGEKGVFRIENDLNWNNASANLKKAYYQISV